jgi:hypothetical protein
VIAIMCDGVLDVDDISELPIPEVLQTRIVSGAPLMRYGVPLATHDSLTKDLKYSDGGLCKASVIGCHI